MSSAADGIYLKRCLEFLVDEAVIHECLVAALHLCHRRGPGKLRHIAGKLLWIQDLVAQEELRVRAVGTLHNVADLGTKPLSRNRIMLILYWCNARSGDDEKLGEEEYIKMEESRVNRVKNQKLAKLLNRILLVGGLEQAAASRTEGLEEKVEKNNSIMMMVVVVMALMIAALAWAVYKLWGIVEELKIKIADAKDSAYVNGVSTRAYVQGMREEMKEMKSYSQKIHRGLIKASGYIDKEEVNEEEWKHWNYVQDSNKDFDLRRIHAQIEAYKRECARDDGPIDLRPYRSGENEETQEETEEETVTVRLDNGEIVEIPLRFVEAREPESEDEAPGTAMEVSEAPQEPEWADEDLPTPEVKDPSINQATKAWLTREELLELRNFDTACARSGLRAKQHILKLQDAWQKADHEGDHERKLEIYAMMDKHYPFMDSEDLPF